MQLPYKIGAWVTQTAPSVQGVSKGWMPCQWIEVESEIWTANDTARVLVKGEGLAWPRE